MYLLKAKRV